MNKTSVAKVPGAYVVKLVLEGLGNEALLSLAKCGFVSVKLHVPASDSLDEEDFLLEFFVEKADQDIDTRAGDVMDELIEKGVVPDDRHV